MQLSEVKNGCFGWLILSIKIRRKNSVLCFGFTDKHLKEELKQQKDESQLLVMSFSIKIRAENQIPRFPCITSNNWEL